MKKSKIIIPAAAILALSVGASVTGTVAWFTASNRATVTANDLAVINAQGALTATNTAISGCSIESSGNVKLNYLQDASYNYESDKTYVAVLDTDGKLVVGSREVPTNGHRTLLLGTGKEEDIYYVSQWTTKFETTSKENQYLFFDNHLDKSYLKDGVDDADVYKALRVSMVCGGKKILWAPYTGESTLYYLNKATTLAEGKQYDVDGTEKGESTNKQDVSVAFGDAVTRADKLGIIPNAKEGDSLSTTITDHKLLLSDALINTASVSVKITVWFEGLDQDCIDGKAGLNTSGTTAAIKKVLNLSYYAVASASFVA